MARMIKGVVIGTGLVACLGLGVAAAAYGGGRLFGFFGGDEVKKVEVVAPLSVEYGDEPRPEPEPKPTPEPKPRPTASERIIRASQENRNTQNKKDPEETLAEKFLARVNAGEMLTFGDKIESREGGFSDGTCSTLRPYRVRAIISDNATTDQPGMAYGMVTENVQGEESDGSPCVAVPAGSVITTMVAQVGEYATNRADVTVEKLWTPDGTEIEIKQPAKHIDGVPGVVGEANHHVWSKTLAMVGAIAFRGFDNITSIGQFNTGQATDPIQDAIAKKFNRPSEIKFERGVAVEFDLMPVTTPGY
jgi:hypothetical protein